VPQETLAATLRRARRTSGLSLRDVERQTGIHNAHLSQLETGRIARPEPALLWTLAALYELDFEQLLAAAGLVGESAPARRRRVTVALRALGELTAEEQEEILRYMAEVRSRRP
jgi:HTH-type transcriptional regulator, competence development regulator